jgi:cold shock CspA family protein
MSDDMDTGTVINFHENRGFGFIRPDGARNSAENVFFHVRTFRPAGYFPRVGSRVVFTMGVDKRSGRECAQSVEEI